VVPAVLSKNVFRPQEDPPLVISFKAPENGEVTVRVYNLAGELVMTPFKSAVANGLWYQANWDGRNDQAELVASGVYFVSVRGAGIKTIRRASAWWGMGHIFYLYHKKKEALICFNQVLELQPGMKDLKQWVKDYKRSE
jgi:hypothetical protein